MQEKCQMDGVRCAMYDVDYYDDIRKMAKIEDK